MAARRSTAKSRSARSPTPTPAELRNRTGDLDQANQFLETILTDLRSGVAVLDADMRVLVWNRRADVSGGGAIMLMEQDGSTVGQLKNTLD